MAELPRCASCRSRIDSGQVVHFREDARPEHVQCPAVTCPACGTPVLPMQPIRRDGERIVHGNCWRGFAARLSLSA